MKLVDIFRPQDFGELAGLNNVKEYFKADLKTLPHSYIFSGNPGVGKTTVARIIANRLNAEITELNAADDTGIDKTRDLIELIDMSTLSGNPRVFIIDEAHKLSNSAQNAYLKPVEDGFKKDFIIFCTTEKSKLIKTLQQRCVSIDFKNLTKNEIKNKIRVIIQQPEFVTWLWESDLPFNPETFFNSKEEEEIIELANGSMRLGLKLFEEFIRAGKISEEMIEGTEIFNLYISLWKGTLQETFQILEDLNVEPESIRIALINMFNSSLVKAIKEKNNYKINMTSSALEILLPEQRLLEPDKKPRLYNLIFRIKSIKGGGNYK